MSDRELVYRFLAGLFVGMDIGLIIWIALLARQG